MSASAGAPAPSIRDGRGSRPTDRSCPGCLLARAAIVWLAMMAVETAHGIARTLLLATYLGDFRARQMGVLTGSALILLIATCCHGWLRAETGRAQLLVGLGWLALTVLFEIGLGRLALGYSWERLLADYNLAQGGLMLFGLVTLMLAPLLAARLMVWTRANRRRT